MPKYTNPMNQYRLHGNEKTAAYNKSVGLGENALQHDNSTVPLASKSLDEVEFIGGFWRVQHGFNKEITMVRNVPFVLGAQLTSDKLAQFEIKFFKYYHASMVCWNCYGPILAEKSHIVANFRQHWAYGPGIAEARAFLAVRVLDYYTKPFYGLYTRLNNRSK